MAFISLPYPHPKQLDILRDNKRFKVICCGRRFGKSLISICKIIESMTQGKTCMYLTPEYDLAKHFFNELASYFPADYVTTNKSDLIIELENGGSCKFFSGMAIEKIRGREYDLAIIDEAAYIDDLNYAFNAVIRPLLGTTLGECWLISTPKGNNYFTQLYRDVRAGKQDDFSAFHFTSYDNPYFNKSELDSIKANTPAVLFRQEYLAEFTANASNPFNNDDIEKNIITTLSTNKTKVYGIDFALGKDDRADSTSIIGLDSNGSMTYHRSFRIPSIDMQYQIIKDLPEKGALKVLDASSFSAGVSIFQQLESAGHYVEGFQFTSSSKAPIVYELISAVERGDIKYNQETAEEMKVFEMKYNDKGNVTLKSQSGFHDDNIMALAMATSYLNKYFRSNKQWKGLY